jgi:hypothetical protein
MSAQTTIYLTPAQAWSAWQAIINHLYNRGYPREQVAEWTGMDRDHALIRPYPADMYLLLYGRAHTHCKTPPWMPGAGSRRVVAALMALADLPLPYQHVSQHVKMVLYGS